MLLLKLAPDHKSWRHYYVWNTPHRARKASSQPLPTRDLKFSCKLHMQTPPIQANLDVDQPHRAVPQAQPDRSGHDRQLRTVLNPSTSLGLNMEDT